MESFKCIGKCVLYVNPHTILKRLLIESKLANTVHFYGTSCLGHCAAACAGTTPILLRGLEVFSHPHRGISLLRR